MNQQAAARYQRVEDHLVAAQAQCEEAISALAGMESQALEAGASAPVLVGALVRVLKARKQLNKAADVLSDRMFDASAALAPGAIDLDF
jgi:hypothetical protein